MPIIAEIVKDEIALICEPVGAKTFRVSLANRGGHLWKSDIFKVDQLIKKPFQSVLIDKLILDHKFSIDKEEMEKFCKQAYANISLGDYNSKENNNFGLMKLHHEKINFLYPGIDFHHNSPFTCYATYFQPVIGIAKDKQGEFESWEVQPSIITDKGETFPYVHREISKRKFRWSGDAIIPEDVYAWGSTYVEQFQNNLKNGTVQYPSVLEMIQTIRAFFKKNMDYTDVNGNQDEWTYDLMAIWTLGTFFSRMFKSYPYVNLNSQFGAGKSKNLRLIKRLAYMGINSVDPTKAAIFRLINNLYCTFIIDEAEGINKKANSDDDTGYVEVLNAGYTDDVYVLRVEEEDGKRVVKQYKLKGPKIFGSISGVPQVLRDRCIEVILRKTVDDIKGNEEPLDTPEETWFDVKNMEYLCTFKYAEQINTLNLTFSTHFKNLKLKNRDLQLYKPLLVIAYLCGEEYYQRFLEGVYKKIQEKYADAALDTNEFTLIEILYKNIDSDGGIDVTTAELKDWWRVDMGVDIDDKAKWLNPRFISNILKRLGFASKGRGAKGYACYSFNRKQIELIAQRNNILERLKYGSTVAKKETLTVKVTGTDGVTVEELITKRPESNLNQYQKPQETAETYHISGKKSDYEIEQDSEEAEEKVDHD